MRGWAGLLLAVALGLAVVPASGALADGPPIRERIGGALFILAVSAALAGDGA